MSTEFEVSNEFAVSVSSQGSGKPMITIMGDKNDIPLSVAQAKMLVKILETTILAVDVAYREANPYEKRTPNDERGGLLTPLRASGLGSFRPGEYQETTLGFPKPTTQSQASQQTMGIGIKSGLVP